MSSTGLFKWYLYILCVFVSIHSQGQVSFRAIAPPEAVVVGESFQLQYTSEDNETIGKVKPPAFQNFRLVSGPNIYYGRTATIHGIIPIRNTVYTLSAQEPGRYMLPGATVVKDGEMLRSNSVVI